MKLFLAILLVFSLLLPVFAAQSEEEAGAAVLGGELIHEEGDETADDFVHRPFVPEDVERKPIGMDNRVSVNVQEYPYCAICYIIRHAKCGCTCTGTGFLVGPRGVMTAGHVLCCSEHNAPADELTLYFGYRSRNDYLYKYARGTTFWYNNTNNSSSEEYDYGYIKLEERVGDSMGWFGVSARSDYDTDVSVCYAAGYKDGKLMSDYDWVYVSTPYEVKHTIDTEPGYSGCPIFDDDYYAIAINVAHDLTQDYNYGCRVTSWLVNSMRSNGIFD